VPLWLIGRMGSSKRTLGQAVAGLAVVDVFEAEGEAAFRVRESDAIRAVAGGAETVAATGGGAVLLENNVCLMKSSGPVDWLQTDALLVEKPWNAY
jgi:shikimate kinase